MRLADLPLEELNAAAYLVEQERTRSGALTWDRPGIVAHLRKLDLDVGAGLDVALRAAADTTNRAPVAITWPQYRPSRTTSTSSSSSGPSEPTCIGCHSTRAIHDHKVALVGIENDPHPFETKDGP